MKNRIELGSMIEMLIILFLPLSVYSFYAKKISVADILLLFTLIYTLLTLHRNNIPLKRFISRDIFFYIILIIFNTLIQIIIRPDSFFEGIFSFLRYLLFMIFILVAPKYFVNKDRFFRTYKFFAIIFALYSILQFVMFYVFNRILPNSIPFLPTMTDFNTIFNMQRFKQGILFRPYSCFQEPSYFAFFESFLFFKYLNFYNYKTKKDYIYIIIIAFSMLISGTTGILTFLFSVFYKIFVEKRKKISKLFLLIIVIIPLLMLYFNSNYGNKIFSSIFVSRNNSISLGFSTFGRIKNYSSIFINRENIYFILGKGLWVETDYLPSFGRLIASFGIIGTILFFIILINFYNRLTKEGKCYWFILFVSLFVTNSLFTISFVLVFSLLISNYKKTDNNCLISEV